MSSIGKGILDLAIRIEVLSFIGSRLSVSSFVYFNTNVGNLHNRKFRD